MGLQARALAMRCGVRATMPGVHAGELMRLLYLSTAMMGGIAACAMAPAVTERTVTADPARVLDRIGAELERLGFRRTAGSQGALDATAARATAMWAACPPVLVGDGDDRRLIASAERRYVDVRVVAMPAGAGTVIAVTASFRASYRNRARGGGFERPCRSTGTLEDLLLATADG